MKKALLLLSVVLLLGSCATAKWPSQKFIDKYNYQEIVMGGEKPEKGDETRPMYPGGFSGIMKQIQKEFKYPKEARNRGIEGKVYVAFTIDIDGYLDEVKVLRSPDPILSKESVRIIKTLDRFIPGVQRGKPVRVMYTLPINFMLM